MQLLLRQGNRFLSISPPPLSSSIFNRQNSGFKILDYLNYSGSLLKT